MSVMRVGRVVFRESVDVPTGGPSGAAMEGMLQDPIGTTRQQGLDVEMHFRDGLLEVENRQSKRKVLVPMSNIKSFAPYTAVQPKPLVKT